MAPEIVWAANCGNSAIEIGFPGSFRPAISLIDSDSDTAISVAGILVSDLLKEDGPHKVPGFGEKNG